MKKKIIMLLLTAILFQLPREAAAVNGDIGAIDIHEATRITLEDNSELRSLRQEIVKAFAFKVRADGTLLPSVSAGLDLSKQKEETTNDGSRNDSREARISLEQVISSGGKDPALRRQSRQAAVMANMLTADGENRVIGELYARFHNVLLLKDRIKAEESAVGTSEQHLKEIRRMRELGLANSLEVIRAGQQLAVNTANLSGARGLYEAAHISLMNYMGIPPEKRLEIRGSLTVPEPDGDRKTSLERAESSRADLMRLKEQLEYQKNQILIEKSGTMPKITLGLSSGYVSPYLKDDRSDDTWKAQLSVAVPIFDRNTARGNTITAKAVLEQDRIALEQKELDIKSEVETAWTEVENSLDHLRASEKALELAEESLRLAEVGFHEGVTPQLDLLSAQTSLTSARLNYSRSQYSHLLTIVALKVTEGNVIEWAGERR